MSDLPEHALRKLLADAAPLLGSDGEHRIDKYRIVRELGRGGMGVVYEAEDTELGRRVALKVRFTPLGAGPELRERFEREALAAARLNHPNIAAVFEARGDLIAMQLVDGVPLSALPPGDRRRSVRLLRDAARAVHYAHERGIVHRDLKPQNLMVEGERVVVTDFGLAKETAVESSLSVSGHILGTPAYMAPEQASGRVHAVDARTDVYGLGATLYDVLAGRPPFVERDVVRLLRQIVEDEPPRLRDVPFDLETIVRKCLAKEPERRYASAQALADDLTRWLDGEPVQAQPPSWRYRFGKFVRKRRAAFIVGAVGLLAVLAAVAVSLQERALRRGVTAALALAGSVEDALDDARVLHAAGQIELRHERLQRAIAACREFLARHGGVAQAHYLHGKLLRSRGDVDAALAALDAALRLVPTMIEARLERGLLLVTDLSLAAAGVPVHDANQLSSTARLQRDRALADLQACAARAVDLRRFDVEQVQAELALLHGDFEAARARFAEMSRLEPTGSAAREGLRRVALATGDYAQARRLAMQVVDIQSGFAPSYERRAITLRLAGVDGVLFDFAGALSNQAAAFAHRSVAHARTAVERAADAAAALPLWEAAIADADAALALDGELVTALNNRAVYRCERARVLEGLGRTDDAGAERQRAAQDLEQAHRQAGDDAVIAANRSALASGGR